MILDECTWGLVLDPKHAGWKVVRESLLGSRAASDENHLLHVGGTYWSEHAPRKGAVAEFFASLGSLGRVTRVGKSKVDEAEKAWQLRRDLACDTDHWALAISEVGLTRCLVSLDVNLKKDFEKHRSGVVICKGTVASATETAKKLKQKK